MDARPLVTSGFESGPPAEGGAAPSPREDAGRVTPVMEQYIEIKAANPDCLLFYRMGDFYELFFEDAEIASRALGIVLTKRGKHLGRDIPMCGVPIHRSDEYLHRLIALGHRVAVCEQIEDPARGEQARRQERRAARRRAPRHARHADRGHAARRAAQQLSARDRARARRRPSEESRFALAWIDISTGEFRIAECDRAGPGGRDRAARAGRDHRLRRALCRRRACAVPALAAGRDAADPRRVRRRHRRAAAGGVFLGRDHRSVRHAVAAGTDRRRRLHHLCRAHAARPAAAAVAAAARGAGRDARDRPGDARQSRTGAHAVRRAARLAARRHRPHRDGRRLAAAGAAAGRAADRSGGDRAAARRRGALRRRCAGTRATRASA